MDHDGSPELAPQVRVAYSRNGTLEQVTAGTVIFACWHAAIPYIAADLPSEQEALGQSFKLTNIYGNVVLRNWKPFKEQRIYLTMMPGSKKWHGFYPDFPVSMGTYEFPSDPNEPMIVQFWADLSADEPRPFLAIPHHAEPHLCDWVFQETGALVLDRSTTQAEERAFCHVVFSLEVATLY